MQCLTESAHPCRLHVVRRLLHLDGLGLYAYGSNGNRVHVHGTRSGHECCGSEDNELSISHSGPGVFLCLWVSSILATQELGLGLWACAHLPRANQHLLFARMYSSIDILVETRDEGVLR